MRRITLITALFVLFWQFPARAELSITIGNVSATPNSQIVIPVDVDFSGVDGGVGALTIFIDFDPAVLPEFEGFSNVAAGMAGIDARDVGGMIMITWVDFSLQSPSTLKGRLLDLEFFYLGGNTSLEINTTYTLISDNRANFIPFGDIVIQNGSVERQEALYLLSLTSSPTGIGAVLSGSGNFNEGEVVEIGAAAVENYSFTGWSGNPADVALLADSNSATTTLTMPGRDVPLVANYVKDQFRLVVHIAGEGNVLVDGVAYADTMYVDVFESLEMMAVPDNSWSFAGWSGDLGGTETETTLLMDANKTVTATFEEIIIETYLLQLIASPGNIGAVLLGGGTYEAGDELDISASSVAGYRFAGWTGTQADLALLDDVTALTNSITMPARAVTLTANYIKQVSLSIDIVGEGSVQVNNVNYTTPLLFDQGDFAVLTAFAEQGWLFEGWSGDLTNNNSPFEVQLNADIQLTATFGEIPQYYTLTITVINEEGGYVRVNGQTYIEPLSVLEGSILTLQHITQPGWQFDGWEGDLSGDESPVFLTMDADKDVVAVFSAIPEPEEFTLTITIVGEGSVSVDGQEYVAPLVFEEGTTVDLLATAEEGWQFDGWSGNLLGTDAGISLSMNGNKNITATFSEIPQPVMYTLQLNVVGNGTVSVNGQAYTQPLEFEEGEQLSLVATAGTGWQFDGWSGDLSSTQASVSLTMNSNKAITATFSEIPPVQYELSVVVIGSGSVMVNGQAYEDVITVNENTELTLTAVADNGWTFGGWSGDLTGNASPASLVMNENKSVTATFSELPPPTYTLRFQLTDQNANPVTNATIILEGFTYPPGIIEFGGLTPGTYAYTVKKAGYFDKEGSVQITDEDVILNIVMQIDNTGIDDAPFTNTLRIYPNPSNHLIRVDSGLNVAAFRIYNVSGQMVLENLRHHGRSLHIDVSGFETGTYFLQIVTEKGTQTEKIQVTR